MDRFIGDVKTEAAKEEPSQISYDELVSCNNKHSHPPNSAEIAVELVKEKMKKRANGETTRIPQIYYQALQEVAQHEHRKNVAAILPTFSSVKSSLYRKRHERLPPLPHSVDELDFGGEWSKTFNGEDFMLGVFMFSTGANLKLISGADTIYTDETFPNLPSPVLPGAYPPHAFKHGQQFPLAYFLLPGKSREVYNTSFVLLKEAAQNLGLDVNPEKELTGKAHPNIYEAIHLKAEQAAIGSGRIADQKERKV